MSTRGEPEFQIPSDDDWRLMGQELYLTGAEFRFAPWREYKAGWDHDHCEMCRAEISADTTGHADHNEAWVTTDGKYQWVCPECFTDFRERFNWTVVE